MKKLYTFVCFLLIAFLMAGCGAKKEEATTLPATENEEIEETVDEIATEPEEAEEDEDANTEKEEEQSAEEDEDSTVIDNEEKADEAKDAEKKKEAKKENTQKTATSNTGKKTVSANTGKKNSTKKNTNNSASSKKETPKETEKPKETPKPEDKPKETEKPAPAPSPEPTPTPEPEKKGLLALSPQELKELLDREFDGENWTQYYIDTIPFEKLYEYMWKTYGEQDMREYYRTGERAISEDTVECDVTRTQKDGTMIFHKIRMRVDEEGFWKVISDKIVK